MRLRIGARTFDGPGPFLMGIVNATPDSFSDGGRWHDPELAAARVEALFREGADVVDLGGESTRPGAPEVPAAVEIERVVPVIERLRGRGVLGPISVDTRKAAVAKAALDAGADLVNDVSALSDPDLGPLVAARGVPVVLMHMRGTPHDMATRAVYADVVGEVERELEEALGRAVRCGVQEERILLDPGIGFAKRPEHSLALLGALPRLRRMGRPLVVGPSRKSFIAAIAGGVRVEERLPGTLAAVSACVLAGVEVLRVHDVREARQAALVAAAIRDATGSAEGGRVVPVK